MRSTVGRVDVIHADRVTNPGSENSTDAGRLVTSIDSEPTAAPLIVLVIVAATVTPRAWEDAGAGVGLLGEPPQAAVAMSGKVRAAARSKWRHMTLPAGKRMGWVTGLEPATS